MENDPERRKQLTFEQAEGLEELPSQLELTEVSQELRAALWKYIYDELSASVDVSMYGTFIRDPWKAILQNAFVFRFHQMADDFPTAFRDVINWVKPIFQRGSYSDIYGFLQHVMRFRKSQAFANRIDQILTYCRAPYRVIDQAVICPIGSPAEAETIKRSFDDLRSAGLEGASQHLRNAATRLTEGEFANSIRESVHAVESVARSLEPSGELSKALAKLEGSAKIHGALKSGFNSIYGYSSDAQGIRHALVDKGAPDVDESDALFMIGACAAFVSYLVNKGRKAGIK